MLRWVGRRQRWNARMNAARFARHLIEDGVDQKLADALAEHLSDEIERTVATKDQVEMVVTREVQQLRVEMHQEFQRFDERMTGRLDDYQNQMTRRLDHYQNQMTQRLDIFQNQMIQRLDIFQNQMTQRLDSQSRWLTTSMIVLFLAILGNIIKDFLR
jgi:adenylate kinase family enzyme